MEQAIITRMSVRQRGQIATMIYVYTVDYGRHLPAAGGRTAEFTRLIAAREACRRNGFTPIEKF